MTQTTTSIAEDVDRIIEDRVIIHHAIWTFLDGVYEAEVASEAAG